MTDVAPTTQPISAKRHLSPVAFFFAHVAVFNVLGIALVLVGCGAYIMQINGSVTTGYTLRDLQTKVDTLAANNQHLEVAVRKSQSLESVENSVKILGLVPAENPTYVQASSPSYAMAQ